MLLPRSSRLSYRPGETREPVTATRIGRYTARGFSPSSSQRRFSVDSISAAVQGSVRRSAASAAARMRVSRSPGSASMSWKRKPAKPGNSPRRGSSPARAAPPRARDLLPVDSLFGEVRDEPGRVLGSERAQVHAVHPVELGVVERRRARSDALEREPLDELVADMIVVSPSGAQPRSARKFMSASGT